MRKIVKPAHPGAKIPDPDRGRYLPPGGQEVTWSAYWQHRKNRGEITVSDVPTAAPATDAAAPGPAASKAASTASAASAAAETPAAAAEKTASAKPSEKPAS